MWNYLWVTLFNYFVHIWAVYNVCNACNHLGCMPRSVLLYSVQGNKCYITVVTWALVVCPDTSTLCPQELNSLQPCYNYIMYIIYCMYWMPCKCYSLHYQQLFLQLSIWIKEWAYKLEKYCTWETDYLQVLW